MLKPVSRPVNDKRLRSRLDPKDEFRPGALEPKRLEYGGGSPAQRSAETQGKPELQCGGFLILVQQAA